MKEQASRPNNKIKEVVPEKRNFKYLLFTIREHAPVTFKADQGKKTPEAEIISFKSETGNLLKII
eukprot:snap_masked-scaffold_38-processed-gene-0.4-mRNA-1 protein AED:1.00 eAED:1.00 QI:0/0/0/0/1/1/2/0/64